MIRSILSRLLRGPAGLGLLLFVPAAAALVYALSTANFRTVVPGPILLSFSAQEKAAVQSALDPATLASTATTRLPTLGPDARIVLTTPSGPELNTEVASTAVRNTANQLTLATSAPVGVAADTGASGQSDEPPPPPPPADTQPPPPPPANTQPPPPPPTSVPPTAQPTQPPVAVDVVICHMPGGDPKKAETKTVGADAVASHLGHGDQLGPCP